MRAAWFVPVVLMAASGFAADFAAGLKAYENSDYVKAYNEWKPIAEEGDPNAQFNIGLLYYDGKGVPQDYQQAADWFRRAADQGYAKAQQNLGELYYVGHGVKRDYVQSYVWFSLCAASGSSNCAEHRDIVAKKLKSGKLAEAQRMAREWKPAKR